MRKKAKKSGNSIAIILAVVILIALGFFISNKATGAISMNENTKIYIQKGDEKTLIFDSTKQLFDVSVEVLPDYKKIFQGDELLIQIILFNLIDNESADVNVKYSIKDTIGKLIAFEEEPIFVETQAKFVRKLVIPSDLSPGNYITFVEVTTPDGVIGTSSDSFEVKAKYKERYPAQIKYYILGTFIVLALVVIIIVSMHFFKKLKKKKEIDKLKDGALEEKIQKLEKELSSLEGAYKSKFISEETYKTEKERIGGRLKKLRMGGAEEKPQEEPEKEEGEKPEKIKKEKIKLKEFIKKLFKKKEKEGIEKEEEEKEPEKEEPIKEKKEISENIKKLLEKLKESIKKLIPKKKKEHEEKPEKKLFFKKLKEKFMQKKEPPKEEDFEEVSVKSEFEEKKQAEEETEKKELPEQEPLKEEPEEVKKEETKPEEAKGL